MFEKMTGISEEYITEAALVPAVGASPAKKPENRFAALSRVLNSGWGVACICFIVAIAAVVGMVAWEPIRDFIGQGNHPSGRFTFYYQIESPGSKHCTALPGDTVYVDTAIQNEGKDFEASNFFARAHFVLQSDPSVVLEGVPHMIDKDAHATVRTIKKGRRETMAFIIHIPDDAIPGVYDLVLSYDGEKQVFGGALTVGDPDARFSFGYELAGDALTGTPYLMDTWVINEGEAFTYEGSSMGFAPTASLVHMETQYRIDGSFGRDDDQGIFTVNPGDVGRVTQEFFIPDDAPTGAYALHLSYGGMSKTFPGAVIVAVPTDTALEYPLLEDGHPFSFGYEPFDGFAIPGDWIDIRAWVVNEGDPFSFVGDPFSFQPAATLYHMESGYVIQGYPAPTGVMPRPSNVLTGQMGANSYEFRIPAAAPTGEYGLKLSYNGQEQSFEALLTIAIP